MPMKNKIYPYPVIAKGNDSYNDTVTFTNDAEAQREGCQIKFSLRAETNNNGINTLIRTGKASFLHRIDCVQTCYRHAFLTGEQNEDFLISEKKLKGKVEVTAFVVANEDIADYKNDDFSQYYRGFGFQIKRGCLLAIGKTIEMTLNNQKDDLQNTASIFSIIPNLDRNQTAMVVDANSTNQKITIMLPQEGCNMYKNMRANLDIQPVMHAMIIVPALMYVFEELKVAGELYEYDDCRWFKALSKVCRENLHLELNEQGIKSLNSFETAQKLLDSPAMSALKYFAGGPDDED